MSELDGSDGFSTRFRFTQPDLALVRSLIRDQWLQRVAEVAPTVLSVFEATPMDQYHLIADLIDHKSLWPKASRILPEAAVAKLRNTGLIKELERELGPFRISNEEEIEREEAYWRIVRPGNASDVGPLHADEWFWSLGHGKCPVGVRRVKVWIAIHCDTGMNGFIYVPGSHVRDWPYHGENRDGLLKPQIDFDPSSLDVRIFKSEPGQAIVFHDRLLHGGTVGGKTTRLSLEFTMFVDPARSAVASGPSERAATPHRQPQSD